MVAAVIPTQGVSFIDVDDYLTSTGMDADDPRRVFAQDAMSAEQRDQANRLRFPTWDDGTPYYDDALKEALCRRVARNLAVRPLPLGVQPTVTDAGAATAYIASSDPEVRRLEAPYRRRVVG